MVEVHYPCPLFNTSNGDIYELVVVDIRVSVACFSFLGSLFVIGLIWLFKKYKFFTQRLILYLSIASLINSVSYLLGRVDYEPDNINKSRFCTFTGFLLLYSDWSVLLSTFGITLNLMLKIIWQSISSKYEIAYFVLSFGVPLLFVWVPFTFDAYGPSGAWCWIRTKYDDCTTFTTGRILQFVVWYIPLYLLIGTLFLIYLFIVIKVRLQVRKWQGIFDPHVQHQRLLLKEEIKPLLWYPVIYLIVQFFPLLNRIVFTATDTAYPGLFILHVASSPLTGVLIAFAYALDKQTLQRLNWRTIKANLLFRSTDQIVQSYPLTETHEEEIEQVLGRGHRFSLNSSDTESEEEIMIATTSFSKNSK